MSSTTRSLQLPIIDGIIDGIEEGPDGDFFSVINGVKEQVFCHCDPRSSPFYMHPYIVTEINRVNRTRRARQHRCDTY